jgi:poly(A) polymerase
MISSVRVFAFERDLPAAAAGAVAIVRTLADAGHQALLAGGCVRDLLLGRTPEDYDVGTDAPPQRVAELFKATRKVGVLRIVLPKAAKARARKVEVKTA